MKYPKLVPDKLCNSNVKVVFTGDLDITGKPEILGEYIGRCNLSRKTKQVMTADKRLITLEATALFDGDIEPHLSTIKGKLSCIELFAVDCENNEHLETESDDVIDFENYSKEYNIFRSAKEKNPDGTVNYTRLELI